MRSSDSQYDVTLASDELEKSASSKADSSLAARYSDQLELQVGDRIEDYLLEELIGQGGMGRVFRATHQVIGKVAAIKILQHDVGPRAVERLVSEARAVNKIGHENIVDVFSFGLLPDGRPYVVMELLVGEPLDVRMQRERLSLDEAFEVIIMICDALIAAHEHGIVHRDLKPANVFILDSTRGIRIKLLDFGIAKFLDRKPGDGLTTDGVVVGTPSYLAPEQATSGEITSSTDVYALGVVLFEILMGKVPFRGQNALETAYAHVHRDPPRPSDMGVTLPRSLEALLMAMLAKQADERPALHEVKACLDAYRDGALSDPGIVIAERGAEVQSTRSDEDSSGRPFADTQDLLGPTVTLNTVKRGPTRYLRIGLLMLALLSGLILFVLFSNHGARSADTSFEDQRPATSEALPRQGPASDGGANDTGIVEQAIPTTSEPAPAHPVQSRLPRDRRQPKSRNKGEARAARAARAGDSTTPDNETSAPRTKAPGPSGQSKRVPASDDAPLDPLSALR